MYLVPLHHVLIFLFIYFFKSQVSQNEEAALEVFILSGDQDQLHCFFYSGRNAIFVWMRSFPTSLIWHVITLYFCVQSVALQGSSSTYQNINYSKNAIYAIYIHITLLTLILGSKLSYLSRTYLYQMFLCFTPVTVDTADTLQ